MLRRAAAAAAAAAGVGCVCAFTPPPLSRCDDLRSSQRHRAHGTPTTTLLPTKKREGYISWDDYFMSVACLSAMRSKDPRTQVGACIVSPENRIVGIGYNGFPVGCSDDTLPWAREGPWLETKFPYVCHAEMNAVLNCNTQSLKGCRIYVSLAPCNECAKIIIQSGITEVIFLSDAKGDTREAVASRRMLQLAGVRLTKYKPAQTKVTIDNKESL